MQNILAKVVLTILSPFIAVGAMFHPVTPTPSARLDVTHLEQTVSDLQRKIDTLQNTGTGAKLGASEAVPSVVALFETSLASAISSSATSMTLVSATDKAGNTLASSTYPFIIDEGTASEEMVLADCTATACTNMTRGISPLTGTTTVTALRKTHRRGASVKITDGPQLMILSRIINGIGTIPHTISYTTHPTTFNNDTDLVDRKFVTDTAFGSTPVVVSAGGTGQVTLPSNMLLVGNGTGAVTSTSSPTVGYITSTSTTATNNFAGNVTITGKLTASSTQNLIASTTIYTLNVGAVNATSSVTLNGSAFPAATNVQTFSTPGSTSWTKPSNALFVDVWVFSGGGGGGSGKRGTTGDTAGGGAGGGGGSYTFKRFTASSLGTTETVVVGSGGTGGALKSSDGDGNAGNNGGVSSFGTNPYITVGGGVGGPGGSGTTVTGGAGGTVTQGEFTVSGGAGGNGGSAGSGTQGADTTSVFSPRGGGGGAAGNYNGPDHPDKGGSFITNYAKAGGAAGASASAVGSDATATNAGLLIGGVGGGGGAGTVNDAGAGNHAGKGGNGGTPGGGGGGGGGADSTNANNSGAGGDGGAGMVVVITYF